MHILGISGFCHDSAAALVRDGAIVAAAQEARFTRKTSDRGFPLNAAGYCLEEAGIDASGLDYVVFYERPFVKFERLLLTCVSAAPKGRRSFLAQMPSWLREKLYVRGIIRKRLGYRGPVLHVMHHQAHAASAFFPSPFEAAAFLVLDGGGEWTTSAYGVGEANRIRILQELRFPHSLGLLYAAFTSFAGFEVNSGEHQLMGLAPYGEPKYVQTIRDHLIDVKEDGSFRLNMAYFDCCGGSGLTNGRFAALFDGPPRRSEGVITRREMDLARSIQAVSEDVLLRMARAVHRETGMRHLAIAGGVALNCAANGRLLREGPFEDLWVQPAPGDAGVALGAALFVWHQVMGNTRRAAPRGQQAGCLGPDFSEDAIEAYLREERIHYERLDAGALCDTVARLLERGKVVGWFQGRMEFGPHALGARSILADPRPPDMQSLLNRKIRFRESFRPFAPSVLAEHANEYFELDRESPCMSVTAPLRDGQRAVLRDDEMKAEGFDKLRVARSAIPAVTHVDNTAHVHTVSREDHPLYHALLSRFYALTGCPVLINAPFCLRGEPIVCAPRDAYACFMRTKMDYLVMGPFMVDKALQKDWPEDDAWRADCPPE